MWRDWILCSTEKLSKESFHTVWDDTGIPDNTFKNGKRGRYIYFGGRAAFHNKFGLQHAFLHLKRENTDYFMRKCRLQSRWGETTQKDRDNMDT